MIRLSLFACLCAFFLAAAPAVAQSEDPVSGPSADTLEAPGEPDPEGLFEPSVPANPGPEGSALIAGINDFALRIYKANVTGDSNLFLSPASISTAMGLAYRGAAGSTADEIRRVMRYPFEPLAFVAAEGAVLRTMQLQARGRELRTANSLWVEQTTELRPDYLADMDSCCRAGLRRVDFRGDRESARLLINRWVEERTANRIRDLLKPGNLNEGTRAILVNAIYLKAAWAKPFNEDDTEQGPFTLANGRKVDASLMQQRRSYRVIARGGVRGIALPYRGGELEMIVLLPRSAGGLERLERGLTAEKLASWVTGLEEAPMRDTVLTLPRFRLDWGTDLVPSLKALGMETALSDRSDFGLMSPFDRSSTDPERWGFKIGSVIHQAFIEVDEKGSEAAAATAVGDVIITGSRIKPPPPIIFRADHPFFFFIRDTRTDAILFMGRLVNPTPH